MKKKILEGSFTPAHTWNRSHSADHYFFLLLFFLLKKDMTLPNTESF